MRHRIVPRRPWRALAVVAAVLAVPVLLPDAAAAGPAKEEHCVVEVTGQSLDGELQTTPMRCYGSFRAMLSSQDVFPTSRSESASVLASDAALRGGFIAVHFEHAGLTGDSYSVVGTVCTGGWLNFPVAWRNRISSTQHLECDRIDHYTGLNLGGSSISTFGNSNLTGSWNDNIESVQYPT